MINKVNIYIGNHLGITDDDLRQFVSMKYNNDGDAILTDFMKSQQWTDYEPGCIERNVCDSVMNANELLHGASYYESFIDRIPEIIGNCCILIYSPNVVIGKDYRFLKYCGCYLY